MPVGGHLWEVRWPFVGLPPGAGGPLWDERWPFVGQVAVYGRQVVRGDLSLDIIEF